MATHRRRTLVGVAHPRGEAAQCDAAVARGQTAGDRSQVDARCERLGYRTVAQRMQVRIDAEAILEPLESMAIALGFAGPGSVRRCREHETGAVQRIAGRHEGPVALSLVLAHQHDRRGTIDTRALGGFSGPSLVPRHS
jgi:hypothetical protein